MLHDSLHLPPPTLTICPTESQGLIIIMISYCWLCLCFHSKLQWYYLLMCVKRYQAKQWTHITAEWLVFTCDGWMDNHRKDGLERTLKVMIDSQGTNMLMKIKSFGMKAFAKCIKFNKLPTTSYSICLSILIAKCSVTVSANQKILNVMTQISILWDFTIGGVRLCDRK